MSESTIAVQFRAPTVADGAVLWQLVRDSGVLDANSCYLYLLLCRDFSDTCLVAELDSRVIGFVTAYRPPGRSRVLFVWQVGVEKAWRRMGLGLRLLQELVDRCIVRANIGGETSADHHIIHLEATVAPSNTASRRLFTALARRFDVSVTELPGFESHQFEAGGMHEVEPVLRLGPFRLQE
ncbi:MAG: diaminobutyrate acetyltransferase [Planctomycetaceae bacterium]|nr:diaminobutyrate acetyltransferase [Planctomycetaceae bacterium]